MSTPQSPGWYPDPSGGPHQMYWDGKVWAYNPPKPDSPANVVVKRIVLGGAAAATFVFLTHMTTNSTHSSTSTPDASTAVALAPAIPAPVEGAVYLETMREQYFAKRFTDAQLLAEGHRVCDAAPRESDEQLMRMVAADLHVSTDAGALLVGAAHGGLGC